MENNTSKPSESRKIFVPTATGGAIPLAIPGSGVNIVPIPKANATPVSIVSSAEDTLLTRGEIFVGSPQSYDDKFNSPLQNFLTAGGMGGSAGLRAAYTSANKKSAGASR